MITPEFCRTMASYNRWQTENLVTAADSLSEADRLADRGAFFGSIFGTFNHLLWGDSIWLSRFQQVPVPEVDLPDSARLTADWVSFKTRRAEVNQVIVDWADNMTAADIEGTLSYHSTAFGGNLDRPVSICLIHIFNHQTHHRGQIHGMLTAAGARPGVTDIIGLPELMTPNGS